MSNTFVEANCGCDKLNKGDLKKKIILFSVLAAMVPCIIETLLIPVISEILADSSVRIGAESLLGFLVAAIRLAFLSWGGYKITRSKEGTVRFVGIFAFSAAIASSVMGLFDFIGSAPLGEAAAYIFPALSVVQAIVGSVINIKLFAIFECRIENQYVTGAEYSLLRKKMVILIVTVYVLILATGGISTALIAAANNADAVQELIYAVNISLSVVNLFDMLIVYLLSLKVRGVKSDAIGLGGAYYMGRLVTAPVTLLVTGLLVVFIGTSGNNTLNVLSSVINVIVNLITTIASFVIMFKSLKIFFPVREIPLSVSDDRAERILKNLIASKQNEEIEN